MGLFKARKPDPISDRAQTLNARIAALEAEIQRLGSQVQEAPAPARRRGAAAPSRRASTDEGSAAEPVFETVDHRRVTAHAEAPATREHFNELGVRKFDLAITWRRVRQLFQGPTSSNPKLINYLAAGSIKGLRPLRYEKRVARNRVIALTIILVVVFWGVIAAFHRH